MVVDEVESEEKSSPDKEGEETIVTKEVAEIPQQSESRPAVTTSEIGDLSSRFARNALKKPSTVETESSQGQPKPTVLTAQMPEAGSPQRRVVLRDTVLLSAEGTPVSETADQLVVMDEVIEEMETLLRYGD